MVGRVCLDFQIAQMSLDCKVVAEYDNIRKAAKATGNTIQRNIRLRERKNKEEQWICVEEDRRVVFLRVNT